ncbi:MAG TPA: TPM domain-containing protein [Candidatus Angelobacter sp.]|jgi:uncharacterized membrane protein YgcG
MAVKKVARLIALLCLAVSAIAQTSSYPRMKGVVSDYASKLDQAQITELSVLVKNYGRQTGIEFVVVTVDSLDGQTVGEYAKAIGDYWRIGKADRDNGIVLLWAPDERAYSLRIAAGLTPDLSDADAKTITDENLLPNFKRGEYYAGLKQTVLATMAHLGNEGWKARLQTRANAAVEQETLDRKRRAEEAWQAEVKARQQAEEDQKSRDRDKGIGIGFLLIVVAGCLGALFYHLRNRKAELAEMAQEATIIANNLAAAEKNAPELQRLLDDFAKEMPEQDISKLREALTGQSARILKIKVDAQCVDYAKLASYDECVRVRTNAESESNLLESTKQSLAQIREAKAQSQTLMEQFSRERFEVDQIRDRSREDEINRLLYDSRQGYYQAQQGSSMSVVDWLLINQLLNNSHNQIQQAMQYSQEEPYVSSSSFSNDSSSSSNSSLTSFFGSGSDSSSSSASSGGGGGDFSSGSGSDGSY